MEIVDLGLNFKAKAIIAGEEVSLLSYDTIMATFKGNELVFLNDDEDNYTYTTCRHLRAFFDYVGLDIRKTAKKDLVKLSKELKH